MRAAVRCFACGVLACYEMVLHLLCVNVNTKNVLKGMFCV
nr:MAG TPA: DNA-directed RNA polymerase [Caudoviricetes sp.]